MVMDPNRIGTLFLMIIQIPSFCFIIYIFSQYIQQRSPLRRLQNHLLMCLLVVATWAIAIELPSTQVYFWTGIVTIHTNWFCSIWNLSFLSAAALNRFLMAFMCIERHFLVFRPQLYRTHRSRLLFHYIPLILVISITLLYLIVTSIFIQCPEKNFNYSLFMCGYTCSSLMPNLLRIYIWISVFIPTVLTVISCILLPIRFIIQKRQFQRIQWKRARKMIVQTSIIASVYTFCWLSYTIILQLLISNILPYYDPNISRYLGFLPYMTSLLTPFIVFYIIRRVEHIGIVARLKRRLFLQRQNIIEPADNLVAQQVNPRANDDDDDDQDSSKL